LFNHFSMFLGLYSALNRSIELFLTVWIFICYLGVHLDEPLNWSTHINKTLNKAYTFKFKQYTPTNRNTPLKHECTTLQYLSFFFFLRRNAFTHKCWTPSAKITS
jgi:hypothetical protein